MEPVFITKKLGRSDMVVMSLALYEQQQALLELYQKLGEAEGAKPFWGSYCVPQKS